ncbi:hypothetical protein JZ751_014594 [Albula glossodonta]|uniref:Uncharacterized protein n=1 Tax=Albula glossodonta TaxID=121402 RepID=A0A8T2MY36_9TELE|nr:hypothetical protein JZ751_014594 [Albula glossodonta]
MNTHLNPPPSPPPPNTCDSQYHRSPTPPPSPPRSSYQGWRCVPQPTPPPSLHFLTIGQEKEGICQHPRAVENDRRHPRNSHCQENNGRLENAKGFGSITPPPCQIQKQGNYSCENRSSER